MKKKSLVKIKNFGGGELFDYFINHNQYVLVCNSNSVLSYQNFTQKKTLNSNFSSIRVSKNQYLRSELYLKTKKWIIPTIYLCVFRSKADLNAYFTHCTNQNSFCLVLSNCVFLNKASLISYSKDSLMLANSLVLNSFFITFVLFNIVSINSSSIKLGCFFKLNSLT
jgi:hypothetical protein